VVSEAAYGDQLMELQRVVEGRNSIGSRNGMETSV